MISKRLASSLPGLEHLPSWIQKNWNRLSPLPGGRQLFSRLLGHAIPYTGSVGARVLELTPGFARVELPDRRSVRNHLSSIHAIALCNLAELTGNAALAYSLPHDARFIVTRLDLRFVKKARGTITGTCHCAPRFDNRRQEVELQIELRDTDQDLVASATLFTLVGPVPAL